jgi:hypothetical protein
MHDSYSYNYLHENAEILSAHTRELIVFSSICHYLFVTKMDLTLYNHAALLQELVHFLKFFSSS